MDRTEGEWMLPDGHIICTLERPWLDNEPFVSCIPEGLYVVRRDKTGRHRWYAVTNVINRSAIEIHPAHRVEELEGCIAPCMFLQDGKAYDSVTACELVLSWFNDHSFLLRITS